MTLHRRPLVAAVLCSVMVGGLVAVIGARPAEAAVISVKGSACGYYTNVSLFGGPHMLKGCGQTESTPPTSNQLASRSPFVNLEPDGSNSPQTAADADGAKAQYGPAVIFGGRWPENIQSPQPSGPLSASTQGTPASGTVTSSADITLNPTPPVVACEPGFSPPCTSPGGFGPFPVEGDSLHVECTASEAGVSGSTTFQNAVLATTTDLDGVPEDTEPVPDHPPVNYTRHGVISNVGDVFTVVYNEHILNSDGSLTVNAAHMYLFGPVAVGEIVKGQVTCGTTPPAGAPIDTVAPTCGIPVTDRIGPGGLPTDRDRIGVFDTGGVLSIVPTELSNATVTPLAFPPGNKGPISVLGARVDMSQPVVWAIDVTDMSGNTTRCRVRTPTAVDDSFSTNEDTPVVLPFLSNDSDPDGRPLADAFASGPTNGVLSRNADRSITYTPKPGFIGSDSFMYWAVTDRDGQVFSNKATVTINVEPAPLGNLPVADFDGDADTDVSVFRPSTGTWFVHGGASTAWGTEGDLAVPADYDGDATTDLAVFRPSLGVWFVKASTAGESATAWGTGGDTPVPADYDGDGKADLAVFRPSAGAWMVQASTEGESATFFGIEGDIPVPADYDGDGTADLAVFRPSTGAWYLRQSSAGDSAVVFGTDGDVPVPADYDGDGRADIALFRPSAGVWFVKASTAGESATAWGAQGDVPAPGDYDGDGRSDLALFRPSAGVWFLHGGSTTVWGVDGDQPLPLPAAIFHSTAGA